MRTPRPVRIPGVLSLLCALPLAAPLGCRPVDTKNPETWLARLDQTDPKKRVQAVQELRKLRYKPAAARVAALLDDPMVREDAALALGDLGGPEQVQQLVQAIDTTLGAGSDQAARQANRTNAKIADSLGQIGDRAACPALLRLARTKDELVRLSATWSLGQVRCTDAVTELSRLVDDEASAPLLIKRALVSLGQIGDASAIPALEHGLVLERQGVGFLSEAAWSLLQVGGAAVPPLIQLLQDKDPAFASWARDGARPPAGTYARVAIVLGDLGDVRAAPELLAKLKYQDSDPNPATARLLTSLVRQFAADALGRLRVKEAGPAILGLLSGKDAGDEDLSTFASNALVFLGDRTVAPELLRRASSGPPRPRLPVLQAAALLGAPELKKEMQALVLRERHGAPRDCARAVADLTSAAADEKGACDRLADLFSLYVSPLEAAEACDKAGIPCWQGKLADPQSLVRARAAYELARTPVATSVPLLVKLCQDPEPVARLAAERALGWMASVSELAGALRAAVKPLADQLAAEQGKPQLLRQSEELRRLHWQLSRL